MMDLRWSKEHILLVVISLISLIISFLLIRKNWREYGLLYLLSAIAGAAICYLFVEFKFYSYPVRLFPALSIMPVTAITTFFPFYVLIGVRFSPRRWPWKIPFYWGLIHLGMLGETYALNYTNLIRYDFKWDTWDSYTWWWIYFLIFEWIGGRIVSPENRNPIAAKSFYYGRWAWTVFHVIVISTIFLAGYYLGHSSK